LTTLELDDADNDGGNMHDENDDAVHPWNERVTAVRSNIRGANGTVRKCMNIRTTEAHGVDVLRGPESISQFREDVRDWKRSKEVDNRSRNCSG